VIKVEKGITLKLFGWCLRLYKPRIVQDFVCADCGDDTMFGNYYMVKDVVWEEHGAGKRMLCLWCLNARLTSRRREGLTVTDFKEVPLNTGVFFGWVMGIKGRF